MNFLQPWALGRLFAGVSACALSLFAILVAWQVVHHFRADDRSEGQLALERKAELAATIVHFALSVSFLSSLLLILGADRVSASMRGAMCAYGVFEANRAGFTPIAISILTSMIGGVWVLLHRLDLALLKPELTKLKFAALFFVLPWLWFDLASTVYFVLNLDLSVVSSCCSTGIDAASMSAPLAASGLPGGWFYFSAAWVCGVLGMGLASLGERRAHPALAVGVAILSTAVFGAASLATVVFVAPHVYETPSHTCPFCLFHAEAGYLGYLLLPALILSLVFGLGVGLAQVLIASVKNEKERLASAQASLYRATSVSWILLLCLMTLPVLRYWFLTGGARLWG
ncbi:MAG: hypothetical protein AAF550_03235 [Myxococcota bacterium]